MMIVRPNVNCAGEIAMNKSSEKPDLDPQARRALAEANERRARAKPKPMPKEINGCKGAEPTRFGDWERKGIASDF